MSLSRQDRDRLRREIDTRLRQQKPEPVYDDPTLELELPAWWSRPAKFKNCCYLCGSPTRYVLCEAHAWAAGIDF